MFAKLRDRIAELPHVLRQLRIDLAERYRDWRSDVATDPLAFWSNPAVRIAALVGLGLVAVAVAGYALGSCTPGSPTAGPEAQATPWATLYVACTNPHCRKAYTTQQDIHFKDWPLPCEACGQKTVYRAQRCPACGEWFAFVPGGDPNCPHCAARAAASAAPPEAPPPTAEQPDPW